MHMTTSRHFRKRASPRISRSLTIQALADQLHRSIQQQLDQVEAAAKSNRATPIERTQKRIEVFVQNGLWSDALQMLNSATLPPEARQTLTPALELMASPHDRLFHAIPVPDRLLTV